MNVLILGTADKTEQFLETKPPFFLLDDGPVAEKFIAKFSTAKVFDPAKHSFNPLAGIDYKKARDFATLLYSLSPQGENTLTVRNGKRALTKILLANTTRLDRLKFDGSDAHQEAKGMIDDLLLSPVLKRVLCSPTNFKFTKDTSVIAKLDRAELGDFDAFVLGTLLIGQSQGQVLVPDGGFYLRPFHMSLIRQNRLTCSVSRLEELPPSLKQAMLLIKDKRGSGCTYDDAETLALYAGHERNTRGFQDYVQGVMG